MTALLIIAAPSRPSGSSRITGYPLSYGPSRSRSASCCTAAYSGYPRSMLAVLWIAFVIAALLDNPTPLRRLVISKPLLNLFRRVLPQVSQTEQEAIDAGTVWWDGDLFSGNPDWKKLLAYPQPKLSADERAFLDGPVEELCDMVNDCRSRTSGRICRARVAVHQGQGFPRHDHPEQYGGLGFSALGHSEVVMKVATRSGTAAVPSGPQLAGARRAAVALWHRTAEEQYLPRWRR